MEPQQSCSKALILLPHSGIGRKRGHQWGIRHAGKRLSTMLRLARRHGRFGHSLKLPLLGRTRAQDWHTYPKTSPPTPYNSFLYSVGVFVPTLHLKVTDDWKPKDFGLMARFVRLYKLIHQGCGILLVQVSARCARGYRTA